jgi:hypothetical protein
MKLIDMIMPTPLFEAEAETGGGAETALGGDAPQNDTEATAAPVEQGETSPETPEAETDGGEQESNTETQPEEFAIDVPEGMEAFAPDFEVFNGAAASWLSENPNATPAETLKWAAQWQAERAQAGAVESVEQFNTQVSNWLDEARADKDIGGDKFDENVATAIKAIDTFGSDGLKSILNESGLGNHPEIIRFAVKAGRLISDDAVHMPSVAGGNAGDALSSRYDK